MKSFIGLKIIEFKLIEENTIHIKLSDNSEYSANIESFKDVHCYPDPTEWPMAFIGEFKTDIEWRNEFGIHMDQIAFLSEKQTKSA
jgi:hypothetical protein